VVVDLLQRIIAVHHIVEEQEDQVEEDQHHQVEDQQQVTELPTQVVVEEQGLELAQIDQVVMEVVDLQL
jgi:hypothetical protein